MMEFLAASAWIAFAAFLMSKLFFTTREGIVTDLLFAAAALVMGFAVGLVYGLAGLEIYSIVAAITGGVLLMVGYHAVRVQGLNYFRGRLLYLGRPREKKRLTGHAVPINRLNLRSLGDSTSRWRSGSVEDAISTWESEGGAPSLRDSRA